LGDGRGLREDWRCGCLTGLPEGAAWQHQVSESDRRDSDVPRPHLRLNKQHKHCSRHRDIHNSCRVHCGL